MSNPAVIRDRTRTSVNKGWGEIQRALSSESTAISSVRNSRMTDTNPFQFRNQDISSALRDTELLIRLFLVLFNLLSYPVLLDSYGG